MSIHYRIGNGGAECGRANVTTSANPSEVTCQDCIDEIPCAICGGSPGNSMHGSKHYSSEVANQHEYEPKGT
jgi:hypothetical protein